MSEPPVRYPTAEAQARRHVLLHGPVRRFVADVLATDPRLQSALMLVAHFRPGRDAESVQASWLFSHRPEPVVDLTYRYDAVAEPDPVNLDGGSQLGVEIPRWHEWDAEGDAVPLFAAYCPDVANRCDETFAHWAPLALYHRTGDGVAVEIVGKQIRPWLARAAEIGARAAESGARAAESGARAAGSGEEAGGLPTERDGAPRR